MVGRICWFGWVGWCMVGEVRCLGYVGCGMLVSLCWLGCAGKDKGIRI